VTTEIIQTTEVIVTQDLAKPEVKETAIVEKVETITTVERAESPSHLMVADAAEEEEAIISKPMENPFAEDASPKKKVTSSINKKSTATAAKSVSKKGNKRELVVEAAEEEVVSMTNKRRGPSAASARKAPTDITEEPLVANGETATTPPNKRVKRNL
jgi:hypothetical protein